MPITKNTGRQCTQFAYVDIKLADLVSAADVVAIELLPNAVILSG